MTDKIKSERRNITQPSDWFRSFDDAAKESGVNLSEWMGKHCKKALPEDVSEDLSKRVVAGRPRK